VMPFLENGAEPVLRQTLAQQRLHVSTDPAQISEAAYVVLAVGTPVDEYLNPKTRAFLEVARSLRPHLRPAQTIIIRSTVYPGTSRHLLRELGEPAGQWLVAYCPERIVQGHALEELRSLPQIVAGLSESAEQKAAELFSRVAPKVIRSTVEEAELVKLFSNAWRYIQFSVANQFYMIATDFGVDFDRLRQIMRDGYGRAASLPSAGFAAGPCLLKDTMQLAAFNNNSFLLGHAAMMVNEGLPGFIVEQLARRRDLARTKVGILGMAFKANSDDIRDSLSYKLGKILRFHGAEVLYSDEFARDPTFIDKERLAAESEVIVVAAPHDAYRGLKVPQGVEVVDLWGILGTPEEH